MRENGNIGDCYTVVVVDDEPMAVKAISKIIEKHCPKFQVVDTAGNGQEALEAIQRSRPDLVLTDIAMPLLNGLDMIKAAKEIMDDICFVIISGYSGFQLCQRSDP